MSCNYADGLSTYEYKGKLGLPEIEDAPEEILQKVEVLVKWIKEAGYVVFHTGAGISTSAGIPDFRGPNGVWTLEKKGEKPNINTSFDSAQPTTTHMVLKTLVERGQAKFIITQNIDGLHLRSGLRRTSMAELHGNMFVAKCNFCGKFFVQDSAATTVGEKEIGKNCPSRKHGGRRECRGKLIDTLLDWEANLPELELETATLHSSLADLSICMGTTLQIVPAGNLPLKAKKNPGGKLVIINLQPTKHDKKADLLIHAKVDFVMAALAKQLSIKVEEYSPNLDPTRRIRQNSTTLFEWTIPASAVKRLKAELAVLKKESSKMKKTEDKSDVSLKRIHSSAFPEPEMAATASTDEEKNEIHSVPSTNSELKFKEKESFQLSPPIPSAEINCTEYKPIIIIPQDN